MYKNQLQELAQRSCFNLPSYACVREGPDHAPRFKASVNFNGEIFESPAFCTTLRQAEHSAAQVALNVLSTRGPSRSLTARVLDETGIYKNLLQETAHRAGVRLPVYATVRSGPGHVPTFTSTVVLAGMNFTGEPAKTKKQAEKNAAIAAWTSLKKMPNLVPLKNKEKDTHEEEDHVVVARVLSLLKPKNDCKGQVRRKDQNQPRRKMVRGYRDIGSGSSSAPCSPMQYQLQMLKDLLMDCGTPGVTAQKQNSFVSLVPPPPPPTTSKILLHSSSLHAKSPYMQVDRLVPSQVEGRPETKAQGLPFSLIEKHHKDEEEWLGLGGKLNLNKEHIEKVGVRSNSNSSIVYGVTTSTMSKPFSLLDGKQKSLLSDKNIRQEGQIGSSKPVVMSHPAGVQMARTLRTGGFNPQRIAPAVQIRSVIPVCAAPPPTTKMKVTSPSASSSTSMPSETILDASLDSSKFNEEQQVSSQQLMSEFNKLQL